MTFLKKNNKLRDRLAMREAPKQFSEEETEKYRETINQENDSSLRMLPLIGAPLSALIVAAQAVMGIWSAVWISVVLLAGFLLLALANFLSSGKCYKNATVILYLIEAPAFLAAIVIANVPNRIHSTLAFQLFLIVLPLLIYDYLRRHLMVTTMWTVLFLLVSAAFTDWPMFQIVLLRTMESYLASVFISTYIHLIRFEAMRSYITARELSKRDALTMMKNRYALVDDTPRYLHQPQTVFLMDLDHLRNYNDAYGNEAGDRVLHAFSEAVAAHFPRENCYRYGGDELLVIEPDLTHHQVEEKIKACQAELKLLSADSVEMTPAFACGFVRATPAAEADLQDMIRLAEMYLGAAKEKGRDGFAGGRLSQEEQVDALKVNSLKRMMNRDPLTGLINGDTFTKFTENFIREHASLIPQIVFIYFNIRSLKSYNAEYGFREGDHLLKFLATGIQVQFPGRLVSRIGEDHFAAMVYETEAIPGIRAIRESLRHYQPSATVIVHAGIYRLQEGDSSLMAVDRAKLACDALNEGGDRYYRYYDRELMETYVKSRYIVSHLHEALSAGQIAVTYQPVVRSETGLVCGEEALARWTDPVYGRMNPCEFIPVLEQARLTHHLDLAILQKVLDDFRLRERCGVLLHPVSVNLSRYDFENCDMVSAITRIVDRSGYPRELIVLEITESVFARNTKFLTGELTKLREAGFQIWMDDFGSGYSSLGLLEEFHFDVLKMDMQFMTRLGENEKNRIVFEEIIHLARRIHIGTLAEGVETEEQSSFVKELGCDYQQGYLYGKPVTQKELFEQVETENFLLFEDEARTKKEIIERIKKADADEETEPAPADQSGDNAKKIKDSAM